MDFTATTQMRSSHSEPAPACLAFTEVFHHRLMEEPPTSVSPVGEQAAYQQLRRLAMEKCASCPLAAQCLYDAVVKYDVAGFAAGTTEHQRGQIRRELGVSVAPEDLDRIAGVSPSDRQVSHEEIVRQRKSNPQDSLGTIAARLGCSVSTVKRHLRQARAGEAADKLAVTKTEPSVREVLSAYHSVLTPVASRRRRAA